MTMMMSNKAKARRTATLQTHKIILFLLYGAVDHVSHALMLAAIASMHFLAVNP